MQAKHNCARIKRDAPGGGITAMQAPRACRHCNAEPVPSAEVSYASVLLGSGLPDLTSAVDELERTHGAQPCISFVCVQCQRASVFSFAFHREITAHSDVPPYRTAAEYYRGAVCRLRGGQHEQHAEEDSDVHAPLEL
jgi:hypothetical protein